MISRHLPRICVSAGSSGSGKTTFTCGLLRALIRRNLVPAAFKCGPDYIDPMFHREVTGVHSAALDLFLCNKETVNRLLYENACGDTPKDIAVLEGAMGFYDGLGGTTAKASTWDIARATGTPVILVEDCRSLSVSLAARIKGLVSFREPGLIRGVALNRISPRRYPGMRSLIEEETGVPVIGFLPAEEDWLIPSRHLGLVTAGEIKNIRETIDRIAGVLEQTVDLGAIEAIARSAPPVSIEDEPEIAPVRTRTIRIGIARDRAFCFYYEDGLRLLKKLGAELVPFSPLEDSFPPGLDGLILGGGYPELYAPGLSENTRLRRDIQAALLAGMPCIAECGGFMYLHEELIGRDGQGYPMVKVISGSCRPMPRLVRFGYGSYTARQDNLLCAAGDTIPGHEFHYWESDNPGTDFTGCKPVTGETWSCINANDRLFAGFPHIHLYGKPAMARRFLERCAG